MILPCLVKQSLAAPAFECFYCSIYGDPNRGCIFNNKPDHTFVTGALDRSRTLLQASIQESINLNGFGCNMLHSYMRVPGKFIISNYTKIP